MMSFEEFQGLREESRDDRRVALVVAQSNWTLGWASAALRADRDFAMQLVAADGQELEFVSDSL